MGVVCNGYMRFIDPMKIKIIAILLKIIPSGALCNEPVLGERCIVLVFKNDMVTQGWYLVLMVISK